MWMCSSSKFFPRRWMCTSPKFFPRSLNDQNVPCNGVSPETQAMRMKLIHFHFSADLQSLPNCFYNLLLNASKHQCVISPTPHPCLSNVPWERTSFNYLLLFLWIPTLKVLTLPLLSHTLFVFPGALPVGLKYSGLITN